MTPLWWISRWLRAVRGALLVVVPAGAFTSPAAWAVTRESTSSADAALAQVNAWLLDPSPRFLTLSAAAEAGLYVVSLMSLLGLIAMLAWAWARPPHTWRTRVYRLLAVTALIAAPVLAAVLYRPYQDWLLGPRQLGGIVHQLFAAWRLNLSTVQVLDGGLQASLLSTSTVVMAVLAGIAVLLGAKMRGLSAVICVAVGLLSLAPAVRFATQGVEVSAWAVELAAGERVFDARCSIAGVTRLQPVADVEGVRLTDLRAEASAEVRYDREWPDAGIAHDRTGMAYALSYLDFEYQDRRVNVGWSVPGLPGAVTFKGYAYVDVRQPDGSYLRYRSAGTAEPIPPEQAARYAVSITRNDTPEDRQHWVAGSRVTVTDTVTGHVVGELLVFSHVPPTRGGMRAPHRRDWLQARVCPVREDVPGSLARMFVEQAVTPLRARP